MNLCEPNLNLVIVSAGSKDANTQLRAFLERGLGPFAINCVYSGFGWAAVLQGTAVAAVDVFQEG